MSFLRTATGFALIGVVALAVGSADVAAAGESSANGKTSYGWHAKGKKGKAKAKAKAKPAAESNDSPAEPQLVDAVEARPLVEAAPAFVATRTRPRKAAVRKVAYESVFEDEAAEEEVELGPGERIVEEGEYLGDGEIVYDEEDGHLHSHRRGVAGYGLDECGGCGHCESCDPCEEYSYDDMICFPRVVLDETSIWVGPHAFKGPLDQGRNGNFGFQEGINFAGQLFRIRGIGYQVGAQWVQSNFLGDTVGGELNSNRRQTFLSAGLFHRAFQNRGLQFGVTYDYVDDQYYVRSRGSQLRGEISFIGPYCHELGFWGAFGTRNDNVTDSDGLQYLRVTDLYAAFYRRNLPNGGQGRVWGGATGSGDGLFGADFRVPLSNRFDLNGGFNYLIPKQGTNADGFQQEGWGLSMNIVWYPFRRREGIHNTPYRPLFNVADNNVFMFDRLPQ